MFCKNCGNEIKDGEKFCSKCGNKIDEITTNTNTYNKSKSTKNIIKKELIVFGVFIIGIFLIMFISKISEELSKVEVPNFIDLTVSQAKEKAENSNLELKVYSANSDNEKIISQTTNAGEKVSKTTLIYVYTQEYKEKEKKEQEENEKISTVIKAHGEYVRQINKGEVKYHSYSKYRTTSNGTVVYKIKYTTSLNNDVLAGNYYQYVSLDDKNEYVKNSTKLYYFVENKNDGRKTGDDYEMEYAYESIWGK